MTIRVTVTNSDVGETRIIEVKNMSAGHPSNAKQLKGGESAEMWVHSTQDILISEIRNG